MDLLQYDDNGNTPLIAAIKENRLKEFLKDLPAGQLTHAAWLKPAKRSKNDDLGNCALHEAAIYGVLSQVPTEFLTKQNISRKNIMQYSVLHSAAEHGHLNQLPIELLTEENLLIADNNYWTAFHSAAAYGHAEQIPIECWTQRSLLWADSEGLCIFRELIEADSLDCVLGADLPETMREYMGEEWWAKNEEIKKTTRNLSNTDYAADIDLF